MTKRASERKDGFELSTEYSVWVTDENGKLKWRATTPDSSGINA